MSRRFRDGHSFGLRRPKNLTEPDLRRRAAEEAGQTASDALRRAAGLLVAKGLTVRDAGHMLNVSHQRIAQVASKQPRRGGSGACLRG